MQIHKRSLYLEECAFFKPIFVCLLILLLFSKSCFVIVHAEGPSMHIHAYLNVC